MLSKHTFDWWFKVFLQLHPNTKRMFGCGFGHIIIDFGRPKSILFILFVVWFLMVKINYGFKIDFRSQDWFYSFLLLLFGFSWSKLIIVSKLILGTSENFSLFNSTKIDCGYFFVNYTFKSDFDQYYPNIYHFSDQITKHKSLYLKINFNQINSNKINSI